MSLVQIVFTLCIPESVTGRGDEGTVTFLDWSSVRGMDAGKSPIVLHDFSFAKGKKITIITCGKFPIGEKISNSSAF